MPRVATPDRRSKIIESEADLKALQTEYKLSSTLVANLRQLLAWTGVGNGKGDENDRDDRGKADNFQLQRKISWLRRDGSTECIPVVGKVKWIFETVVQPHPDMNFSSESLRKLLPSRSGKQVLKVVDKWRVVDAPPAAARLPDGASLVGLKDEVICPQTASCPRSARWPLRPRPLACAV